MLELEKWPGKISMNFNVKEVHKILSGEKLVGKQLCRKGTGVLDNDKLDMR